MTFTAFRDTLKIMLCSSLAELMLDIGREDDSVIKVALSKKMTGKVQAHHKVEPNSRFGK